MRVRIQFEKLGAIRFTSHKDLQRIFERCFAAAGVPVSWSEGFHPHMRMSFGPPIKTGWESLQEFMDLRLESPMDGMAEACNAKLPEGLRMASVVAIEDGTPKLASDIAAVTLDVMVEADDVAAVAAQRGENVPDAAGIQQSIHEQFLNTPSADSGEPGLTGAEVVRTQDTFRIRYTSTMRQQRVVTPDKLVTATVGDPNSFRVPIKVLRLAQYVERDGRLVSPIDEGVVQTTS
jgi:radical SAM-linked protein